MHPVRGSGSMRTGVSPVESTAVAHEMIVNVGMITSSPGPSSSASTATWRAVLPLLTATPWRRPQYGPHACSKSVRKCPDDDIQPVVIHSVTYSSSRQDRTGSLTGIRSAPSRPALCTGPASPRAGRCLRSGGTRGRLLPSPSRHPGAAPVWPRVHVRHRRRRARSSPSAR